MVSLKRGYLVTIEGIDGSGKTILAKQLAARAVAEGISPILTKEPGGTPLGFGLRELLQDQPVPIDPHAEFLLFAADRAQHIVQVIKPALAEKKLILSDRMADSSIVYQGFGRGLPIQELRKINQWALQGITPDITFYVKIDYQTARDRCADRGERLTAFEKQGRTFIERLIEGYDALAAIEKRFVIIDAHQEPEAIVNQAWLAIKRIIQKG